MNKQNLDVVYTEFYSWTYRKYEILNLQILHTCGHVLYQGEQFIAYD